MILRTRILALAGVLALLFLSLITYTLVTFSTASLDLDRIVRTNLAVERKAEILNATILEIRSDIWDTMVFDLAHRAEHIAQLDDQARIFYQTLRDLAETDPGFAQRSQALRQQFQAYYQFGSTILELGTLDEFVGQAPLVQKFRQNQLDMLGHLSDTLTASKEQFFGSMDKINSDFAQTTFTAFVLAIAVTLLSLIIAVVMARRLSRPLERLTNTVHQVAGGDYTVRPPLTSSGEIRDLTETFSNMLDQIEDYSTRMEDLVRARTDTLTRTNAVMVKERKLAQKIQDAIVPQSFPQDGPLRVAAAYLPMEDLGGDFFDVFQRGPGQWSVVIADVSGHGVPAALVTTMVKISLGLHGRESTSPSQVLEEVNRELCAAIGDIKRYATMLLVHLDLNKGTLEFCSAGHNELVVVRASADREVFGPNSGIVGMRTDEVFLTTVIPFAPGDSLVLFTDGLIEARGKDHGEFGFPRLLGLIDRHAPHGPDVLVAALKEEVLEFVEGRSRQDDIAVVGLRWESAPAQSSTATERTLDSEFSAVRWAEELYATKEYDELLTWTAQRLVDSPQAEASRLLHWRAMAFHHRGDNSAALACWNEALNIDPTNHRARRNRSFLEKHGKEVQG